MMTPETLNLVGVLRKNSEVFKQELGSMEGINVKLTVEPEMPAKILKGPPLPYAPQTPGRGKLNRTCGE